MRKSNLQWSFSTSQFLSFKSAEDQGGSSNQNQHPPGFPQINLGLEIQRGSSSYPIPGHPWQPKNSVSANQSSEVRIFPANQIVPVSTVSVTPPNGPVVGTTDLKSSSGIATGSCQLTLFYNGSVCVYDNISPEKAQAIMLLAGNGDLKNSTASAAALPSVPLPRPTSNDIPATSQSAGFSSAPVSSFSAVELNPIAASLARLTKFPEPPKSGSSVGVGGVKANPTAVPQARKASLTRFLEKRKERVTGASPYVISKNASDSNTMPSGSTLVAKSASLSNLPSSTVEILR